MINQLAGYSAHPTHYNGHPHPGFGKHPGLASQVHPQTTVSFARNMMSADRQNAANAGIIASPELSDTISLNGDSFTKFSGCCK